jgi:hypothetical protein
VDRLPPRQDYCIGAYNVLLLCFTLRVALSVIQTT